jgi:peroxiredoxin
MSKRFFIALVLILALSTSLVLASQGRSSAAPASMTGQPAPDFALPDLQGKMHALKDYRGRITVIGFLGVECPVSNAYTDRLRALASDYQSRNVVFLGINPNVTEDIAAIRAHAAKNKFHFTLLKDEGSRVADALGATFTPEVYVIDGDGVLRYHGPIDNAPDRQRLKRSHLREALNELLAGKAVSVTEPKTFGCAIKRTKDAQAKTKSANRSATQPSVALLKPADFARLRQQAAGSVLVVNFWATWCGPCVVEFPEFVMLDDKYRAKGVKIAGISFDETSDINSKVIPFIKEAKARFDIYVLEAEDPQEMIDAVTKEWAGALPATFVYDRQGKLTYQRFGIIDRDQLIAALESALKS